MNSIVVIHPYKYDKMWVFDDEKVIKRYGSTTEPKDIDRDIEALLN